jgi:hypothetical protein
LFARGWIARTVMASLRRPDKTTLEIARRSWISRVMIGQDNDISIRAVTRYAEKMKQHWYEN